MVTLATVGAQITATMYNELAVPIDNGFVYATTLTYTSPGSFTKATYPWLRAVRVRAVGGGGGGAGCPTTAAGQVAIGGSGSGAAYAESFLTNIAALAASETVTVGAGGAGGAAGLNPGVDGGASSFGFWVVAAGGTGGVNGPAQAPTGFQVASNPPTRAACTGQVTIAGEPADSALYLLATAVFRPTSGGSVFAPGLRPVAGSADGPAVAVADRGFGVGGLGGANIQSQVTARAGGAGSAGVVYVDLFA